MLREVGPDGKNAGIDRFGKYLYLATDSFVRTQGMRSSRNLYRIGEEIIENRVNEIEPQGRDSARSIAFWAVRDGKLPKTVLNSLSNFVQGAFFLSREQSAEFLNHALKDPFTRYFSTVARLGRKNVDIPGALELLEESCDVIDGLRESVHSSGLTRRLLLTPHSRGYLSRHLRAGYAELTDSNERLLFGAGIKAVAQSLNDIDAYRYFEKADFEAHREALGRLASVKKGQFMANLLTDLALDRNMHTDIDDAYNAIRDGKHTGYDLGLNPRKGREVMKYMRAMIDTYMCLSPGVQGLSRHVHVEGVPRGRILNELKGVDEALKKEGVEVAIGPVLQAIPSEQRGEFLALLRSNPRSAHLLPGIRESGLPPEMISTGIAILHLAKWPHDPERSVQDTIIDGKSRSLTKDGAQMLIVMAANLEQLDPQTSRKIEQTILNRPDLFPLYRDAYALADNGQENAALLAYLIFLSPEARSLRSTQEKLRVCDEELAGAILNLEDPVGYFSKTHSTNLRGILQTPADSADQSAPKQKAVRTLDKPQAAPFKRPHSFTWQELMLIQLEQSEHPVCNPAHAKIALDALPTDLQNRLQWVYGNYPKAMTNFIRDIRDHSQSQVFLLLLRNRQLFEAYIEDIAITQRGMRAGLLDLIDANPSNPAPGLAALMPASEQESVESKILTDQTDREMADSMTFPYDRILVVGGVPSRGYWGMDTSSYPFKIEFYPGHADGKINLNPTKSDYVLMLADDCDHSTYWVAKKQGRSAGSFHHYRCGQESLRLHFEACKAAKERGAG